MSDKDGGLKMHTPGNWEAQKGIEDEHGLYEIEPERWCVISLGEDRKGYFIATIENGAPGDTLDTEAANARLIAAAPDLLAACEASLDESPCQLDHHGDCQAHRPGNPCEQKLIREAIAKAKGLPT